MKKFRRLSASLFRLGTGPASPVESTFLFHQGVLSVHWSVDFLTRETFFLFNRASRPKSFETQPLYQAHLELGLVVSK